MNQRTRFVVPFLVLATSAISASAQDGKPVFQNHFVPSGNASTAVEMLIKTLNLAKDSNVRLMASSEKSIFVYANATKQKQIAERLTEWRKEQPPRQEEQSDD